MPIFPTNKGHGNWFQKSEAKTIEDGIESHLFFPWTCSTIHMYISVT